MPLLYAGVLLLGAARHGAPDARRKEEVFPQLARIGIQRLKDLGCALQCSTSSSITWHSCHHADSLWNGCMKFPRKRMPPHAQQSHWPDSYICKRTGAQAAAAHAFLVGAVAAIVQRSHDAGARESDAAMRADTAATTRPQAAQQAALRAGHGASTGPGESVRPRSAGGHEAESGLGSGAAGASGAALLSSTAASLADLAERLAARAGSSAPGSEARASAGNGYGSGARPSTMTEGTRLGHVYPALLAAGAALTESLESARLPCTSTGGPPAVGQATDADEWGEDMGGEGFEQGFQAADSPEAVPSAEAPLGHAGEQQAEANGGAGGAHSGAGKEEEEGEAAALLAARERCHQVARTPTHANAVACCSFHRNLVSCKQCVYGT